MYAVIATGGKQYRVSPGQELSVEKLDGGVGDAVTLTPLLVVNDDGAIEAGDALAERTVSATITAHTRAAYIRVFTYKNKSRQHKRRGHRQNLTTIRIEGI